MNTLLLSDKKSCRNALADANARKVAFIYHLKIDDFDGYEKWLMTSGHHVKRLYRVEVDPASREGMLIDEIVVDEFSSVQEAFDFLSAFECNLMQVCSMCTILAILPEPLIVFQLVKCISCMIRLFNGVTDKGVPSAKWKADNTAVWPDEDQMKVARSQNINEPLFVYNLNKYRTVAEYKGIPNDKKMVSGKEAYDRYSKIAGFELLRRGAYPVYCGKPICLLGNHEDSMLADRWDHFIFVRYPQRRNLLVLIETDEFHKGEAHRDAGLDRTAIFMAKPVCATK